MQSLSHRTDRYRGLSPLDSCVWHDALTVWPRLSSHCVYGIRVGHGRYLEMHAELLHSLPGSIDWQKRIDVVLVHGRETVAVEVKPWGHSGAIGQVHLYAALLALEQNKPSPVPAMVFCSRPDADVIRVIDHLQVGIVGTNPPDYWGMVPPWLESILDSPFL